MGSSNTTNGDNSNISGGLQNITTGHYSSVVGGANNESNGVYSSVGNGRYNKAEKQYSNVSGGHTNTANGDFSTVGGGQNNITNGSHSTIIGGNDNITDGVSSVAYGQSAKARTHGQTAHAYGKFNTQGDAQESRLVLKNQTTNNALTVIGLNGTSHPQMSDDSSWYFKYTVVARRRDAEGETKAWTIEGLAQNNTVWFVVGTPMKTVIGSSTGSETWDIQVGSGSDSLYITRNRRDKQNDLIG